MLSNDEMDCGMATNLFQSLHLWSFVSLFSLPISCSFLLHLSEEEDRRTIREMIDKLIPNFPKDKREKAKQVLHQLLAESKVTFNCHHEVSIVF